MSDHQLHFGDNLVYMQGMKDASVDLIYLDPPFNSKRVYNVIVANGQAKAFDDTWSWDASDMRLYQSLVRRGGKVSKWAEGMLKIIGSCGMLSYLYFIAERLIECRRILKETGSIYLHCDHAAGYHLRVLMDALFGYNSFRNEVVWHYISAPAAKRWFGRKHDTILFYANEKNVLNVDAVRVPHSKNTKAERVYKHGDKKYVCKTNPLGKTCDDVWDIPIIAASAHERTGYATQKPEALLKRIIKASSNSGDVVFDPFCGSGTAVVVAAKLGRVGIGCDLTFMAIDIAERRLIEAGFKVSVSGEPQTFKQAEALAVRDKWQFEAWMLNILKVNRIKQKTAKKGADGGIDGTVVDFLEDETVYKTIVSVKGGRNKLTHVRDLIGTVAKEQAQRGVLACLYRPTKEMIKTASMAGIGGQSEELCVILSVPEILEGARIPRLEGSG